jgi:hypothetical protein
LWWVDQGETQRIVLEQIGSGELRSFQNLESLYGYLKDQVITAAEDSDQRLDK